MKALDFKASAELRRAAYIKLDGKLIMFSAVSSFFSKCASDCIKRTFTVLKKLTEIIISVITFMGQGLAELLVCHSY